ncbi:MAG: type IV pili twitching motility protein PilT [Candidatus Omnitrophota bacterium]|nr:MAG: type IV pili twitching motility protein PilT [Candidatus Omnitrophota bacterium]
MVELRELLDLCIDRNASDLHLVVGKPPMLRQDGRLETIEETPLSVEDTERISESLLSKEQRGAMEEKGQAEFSFSFKDIARFRVSVYKERKGLGIALRLLPQRIMSFAEIGLPPSTADLLCKRQGLILVTGPTGVGKTTTLASMIDFINSNWVKHIITIEDPIEYYHPHKKSIITQRELNSDIPSFSEAVIASLRQDPDVIMIGEMRDLSTIEAALTCAETGHLVLSTLHTVNASKTIDRIVDVFPTYRQNQIRIQLSTVILAVFSQRLIPRASGRGRIAGFEIMIATPSIRNLIRENQSYKINTDIQTGGKYGMCTLASSLMNLYKRKLISYEEVLANVPELKEEVGSEEERR